MPTQVERLEALANHLLDGFLGLRERYALLEPMLFDPEVVKARGSKRQTRGFVTLRQSLFLTCAQDIAKLTLDPDKRTPSIRNIITALEDESLRDTLRERYAVWRIPSIEKETDPEIIEALRRLEQREETGRRVQFDEHHSALIASWTELSNSPLMLGYCTVRDKVSAHTEVRFVADKYRLVDIGSLGIKWKDLRATIAEMQRLVELIGFIVRNASFAWEMLDRQLTDAARGFWSRPM